MHPAVGAVGADGAARRLGLGGGVALAVCRPRALIGAEWTPLIPRCDDLAREAAQHCWRRRIAARVIT